MPSQRKILLADDTKFFLNLERSFLQRDEIDIIVAHNGKQAYELVSTHRPDLAILDYYMPEMNGDECCRLIKSNPELSGIPVLLVTAAEKNEVAEGRKAGCDDFILKPFDRDTFVEKVNRFLNVDERSEERSPVRLLVMYGKEKLSIGYAVNLSTGGLFLGAESPLPLASILSLKFQLPNQIQLILCKGIVSWVNSSPPPADPTLPQGMGIKFFDLKSEDLHQIKSFLETNHN